MPLRSVAHTPLAAPIIGRVACVSVRLTVQLEKDIHLQDKAAMSPSIRHLAVSAGMFVVASVMACADADDPASEADKASDTPAESPAVMLSTLVRTPDAANLYVGVYPRLPEELDTSEMVELSNSFDARPFDGSVFVWDGESAVYTRYAVDEDLKLEERGSVSFANLGVSGTVQTAFISPTRAYSMARGELQIVVWNPRKMEIIGSIDASAALDSDYPEYDYGEPLRFGDHVVWPILWNDSEGLRHRPEVGVVFAHAETEDPAFVALDKRCGGSWTLFEDEEGDLYVTGATYFGYGQFYGKQADSQPNDCLLRIRAGETEFDPDYYVDLDELVGTPAVYHTWHTRDRSLVAAVWDPNDEPPADPDEYWTAPMQRKLVMIDRGESHEIDGLPKSAVFSTSNYRLDDQLYMLVSSTTESLARSSLYRVDDDGAKEALTTVGDLWTMGRVR